MRQERLFLLGPLLLVLVVFLTSYLTKPSNYNVVALFDNLTIGFIIIPLFLLYKIAFPKLKNQTPDLLFKYKVHWLQSIVFMLGILASLVGYDAALYMITEEWGNEKVDDLIIQDYNILNTLTRTFAVAFMGTFYGIVLVMIFYLLSKIQPKAILKEKLLYEKLQKIKISNIIAFSWVIILISFMVSLTYWGIGSNALIAYLSNELGIFILVISIFISFHRKKYFLNIINNFVGDSFLDSKIESQISFILNLKKFIMIVIFILLMVVPVWVMLLITQIKDTELNMLSIVYGSLSETTNLFSIAVFFIILLQTIEGKLIQHNYIISNNIIFDRFFTLKYVAVPVFFWYLMLIIMWILSMVLF